MVITREMLTWVPALVPLAYLLVVLVAQVVLLVAGLMARRRR